MVGVASSRWPRGSGPRGWGLQGLVPLYLTPCAQQKKSATPPVLVGIRAGCAVRPPALLVSRSGCCTRVCSWWWHRWYHKFQCVHDLFGIRTGASLKVQASWAQLRLTVCRLVVVAGAVCAGRLDRGNRRTDSNTKFTFFAQEDLFLRRASPLWRALFLVFAGFCPD